MAFLPHLQRISLFYWELDSPSLLSILQGLPDNLPSSLKAFQICFLDIPTDLIFQDKALLCWRQLDAALTSSKFPSLCFVEIQWELATYTLKEIKEELIWINQTNLLV